MSDRKISRKDIVNIVYRVMYTLPIAAAIIAECLVWIKNMLAREKYAELASDNLAVGGIYTGVILGSILIGFLASLLITLTRWTKIATGVGIIAALIVMMFIRINPERLTVAALLWLVPVLLADIIREFKKRENESSVVFLLPFLIVSFVMINFIPISNRPVDWSGVVSIYERLTENTRVFWSKFDWSSVDYGESKIGFGEDSSLFKSLKKSSKLVMEVTREYPDAGAVYLTGKIYADFDGREWNEYVVSEGDEEYTRMMDTIETMCAIRETYPYNYREVYRCVKVDIELKDIKTEHMFVPGKMIIGTRGSIAAKYSGDNVYFDEVKRYGEEYSVSYYLLNRNGEDIIKYHKDITEETWHETAIDFRPSGQRPYTYQDLLDYREYVKDVYGKEPELNGETLEKIAEIIDGAESDYDKLCKMESWLASQEYTLDVDDIKWVRSEGDFLDYFLNVNSSGYCSYFATAFVLMARSEGIPARYVQGYRVPSSKVMTVDVTSNMAHSWAEAYIEGVGWIRFDPTPGYSSIAVWGSALREPEYYEELAQIDEPEVTEPVIEEEEIVEEVPYYDEAKRKAEEEKRIAEEKRKQQITTIIVVSTLAGLVLIGLIMVCIRMIVRAVKYRQMSKDEKRIELCMRCMLVLDSLGKRPVDGETLTEFAARIYDELKVENTMFIDVYEHMLYRNGSDVKVSALADNYEELKKLLRGRKRLKAKIRYVIGVIFDRKVLSE